MEVKKKKKKVNKKGFTLIELLAVIIILAILMTLAITAMSGYIRNARKDTFITTAQQYANAARLSFINGEYNATPGRGQCLVVQTSTVALESGSTDSSFDQPFDKKNSYIVIRNVTQTSATGADDAYEYYIQMADQQGNGFALMQENDIEREDVVQNDADDETEFQTPKKSGTLKLYNSGGQDGTCTVVDIIS